MHCLTTLVRIFVVVLIPFIGCGDSSEEGCESDWPNRCEGVVCPDDGNPCTEEYCSAGECMSRLENDGTNCAYDGLSGVCVDGECGMNLCEGVRCDDGNPCTVDSCDYQTGTCGFAQRGDGAPCEFDGLAGVCVQGVCGEDPCGDCDDGNPCTDDGCYYTTGCFYSPVCDDGDDCTEDNCNPLNGLCDFTTPVEDGVFCLVDSFPWPGMCEVGVCVPPCDPESEEITQCPIEGLGEDVVCCPGCEFCSFDCDNPLECLM